MGMSRWKFYLLKRNIFLNHVIGQRSNAVLQLSKKEADAKEGGDGVEMKETVGWKEEFMKRCAIFGGSNRILRRRPHTLHENVTMTQHLHDGDR